MQNRSQIIDNNAENYLKYLTEAKNKVVYSPYKYNRRKANTEMDIQSDIQPIIQNNIQPNIQNNIESDIQTDIQSNIQPNIQNNIQPEKNYNHFNMLYKHDRHRSDLIQNAGENLAKSFSEISLPVRCIKRSRLNDITNHDLFYRVADGDYQRYKQQQKKFLDYNWDAMQKRMERRREIDVNPFNPSIYNGLGKTTLQHNTILNPLPNYTYNKYLERQLKLIESEGK